MQIFGPRIHQGFLLRENRPHQTIPNHRMTQDEIKSNTNIKNDSSNNGNTTTTPLVGQIGGLPIYIYTHLLLQQNPPYTLAFKLISTHRHKHLYLTTNLYQTHLLFLISHHFLYIKIKFITYHFLSLFPAPFFCSFFLIPPTI